MDHIPLKQMYTWCHQLRKIHRTFLTESWVLGGHNGTFNALIIADWNSILWGSKMNKMVVSSTSIMLVIDISYLLFTGRDLHKQFIQQNYSGNSLGHCTEINGAILSVVRNNTMIIRLKIPLLHCFTGGLNVKPFFLKPQA